MHIVRNFKEDIMSARIGTISRSRSGARKASSLRGREPRDVTADYQPTSFYDGRQRRLSSNA
jgi:hypothetical protein